MRLRRLNNIIHRDVGYFFAGTAILYAISGLALNHLAHWDPNFIIRRQDVQVAIPESNEEVTRQWVLDVLKPLDEDHHYRSHDFPTSNKVKIYLDDGSVFLNLENGQGSYETAKRRPLLFQINCLHLNPERAWLIFSDCFAVGLIVISVTGLFVLKGRRGITRRGAVLVTAGMILPVICLFAI